MLAGVKRYREEEMLIVATETLNEVKIWLPTREGTIRFLWQMKKSNDYQKIGHSDFSHWVNEKKNGTYELVVVKDKTNEWEFYPISLITS